MDDVCRKYVGLVGVAGGTGVLSKVVTEPLRKWKVGQLLKLILFNLHYLNVLTNAGSTLIPQS